jgi:hypothetical protein
MRGLYRGILVVALLLAAGGLAKAHEGAGFGFMVKDTALEFDPAMMMEPQKL